MFCWFWPFSLALNIFNSQFLSAVISLSKILYSSTIIVFKSIFIAHSSTGSETGCRNLGNLRLLVIFVHKSKLYHPRLRIILLCTPATETAFTETPDMRSSKLVLSFSLHIRCFKQPLLYLRTFYVKSLPFRKILLFVYFNFQFFFHTNFIIFSLE